MGVFIEDEFRKHAPWEPITKELVKWAISSTEHSQLLPFIPLTVVQINEGNQSFLIYKLDKPFRFKVNNHQYFTVGMESSLTQV